MPRNANRKRLELDLGCRSVVYCAVCESVVGMAGQARSPEDRARQASILFRIISIATDLPAISFASLTVL